MTIGIALPPILYGCAEPERAELFSVNWEREMEEAEAAAIELPPAPTPVFGDQTPAFELPDDGPIAVSIEDVTVMALQRNRDLAVQQLTPVIVGTFERIERGVFDPEAFADFQYGKEVASETDRGTGERFDVEGRDARGTVGLRQDLPSGTTVEATLDQSRSASDRAPEQQEARLGLSITQSLLRGAGPAVNLARVRQAELETLASVYELRGFTEALLAEVERTYWNYVFAIERIAIFERSLAVAERQRDETEQRIEVGVLAETEAAATRAEVALREQALIEARSQLEAERLRLLRLVNVSPDVLGDRDVRVISDALIEPTPITDLEDHLSLAGRLRPDLNEARLRLEQNRLETIVTRNGLLPRLDLFINVGKSGFADTFSDSFKKLDEDSYDFAAGVSFSQALGNDAAEGRNIAAYASREQAAKAVSNLEQLVRLDVRLAANEVARARQQMTASAATRELQEAVAEAEQERLDVGSSTTLQVAQAQRDLLQAQINEVEAVISYRLALIDLYLAEGSLLERRGITVGP